MQKANELEFWRAMGAVAQEKINRLIDEYPSLRYETSEDEGRGMTKEMKRIAREIPFV